MDAFESVIALLLRLDGYWTQTSYKIELTKAEKVAIGTPSCPRWEIDVLGYKPATNEVLAVECKSYLDSYGVDFDGSSLTPPDRYKLFTRAKTREVVLGRLTKQLVEAGACLPEPTVKLALAAGKLKDAKRESELEAYFQANGWRLLGPSGVARRLRTCVNAKFENDVAYVTAKILGR